MAERESLEHLLSELPPEEADELRGLVAELGGAGLGQAGRLGAGPAEEAPDGRASLERAPWLNRTTALLLALALVSCLAGFFFDGLLRVTLSKEARVATDWVLRDKTRESYYQLLEVGAKRRLLAKDPWGRRYVEARRSAANGAPHVDLYSCGPNGQDDDGRGDDVVIDWFGAHYYVLLLANYGDSVLVLLGLPLVWLAGALRVLRTRASGERRVENLRTAAVLSLPVVLGWVVLTVFGDDLLGGVPHTFLLPDGLVLWGSAGVGLLLAFFALRAFRRSRGEASAEPA